MKLLSICLFAVLFFFQAALGFRFAHAGALGGPRAFGGPGGQGPPSGGPPGGHPPGHPPGPPPNATSSS